MVDTLYEIYRAVALLLTLLALFISTLEILCVRWKKSIQTQEKKYYIHYCCAISFTILIFASMDPSGVFEITGLFAFKFILIFSGVWIEYGFCLIIYCHFHAHYLTLRKLLPKFIARAFVVSVSLKAISNIIGQALVWHYNSEFWIIIGYLASMLWLACILAVDLTGYYLVRKAIKDIELGLDLSRSRRTIDQSMRDRPASPSKTVHPSTASTPPSSASAPTQHLNYSEVLARMLRFHVMLVILCLLFFSLNVQSVMVCLDSYHTPPSYPNPNVFGVPDSDFMMPLIYQILWLCLTWWAWIPLSILRTSPSRGVEIETEGKSVGSTHLSKSENPGPPSTAGKPVGGKSVNSVDVPPVVEEEWLQQPQPLEPPALEQQEIIQENMEEENDEHGREKQGSLGSEVEWKGEVLLQKLKDGES